MIDPIIFATIFAIANMLVGWDRAGRTAGIVFSLLGFLVVAWPAALVAAIALTALRLVGWYRALDMGRNDHTVYRDFAIMFGIACLPAGFAALALDSSTPLAFAALMPCAYALAMWVPPWKPGWHHIKIAEALSGAALGFCIYFA